MADENETKIRDAVGPDGTKSPTKSPADVPVLSVEWLTSLGLPNVKSSNGPPVKHAVYLISCQPYLKIGYTWDIGMRLGGLRTHNPHPIELVDARWFSDELQARFAEMAMHKLLHEHWHSGEWFTCPHSLAIALIDQVAALTPAVVAGLHLRSLNDAMEVERRWETDPEFRAQCERDNARRAKISLAKHQNREWRARKSPACTLPPA